MDGFDRELLRQLQRNARQTAEQLSATLGLSPAAVQKRLKRLRESGVIEREIAVINPASLGPAMTVIVEVSLLRETLQVLRDFKARMLAAPLVQQCYYTTGEADFTLILVVRDIDEYERFTHENFFGSPEVSKFKTSIVMDRVKCSLSVPIPAD